MLDTLMTVLDIASAILSIIAIVLILKSWKKDK